MTARRLPPRVIRALVVVCGLLLGWCLVAAAMAAVLRMTDAEP